MGAGALDLFPCAGRPVHRCTLCLGGAVEEVGLKLAAHGVFAVEQQVVALHQLPVALPASSVREEQPVAVSTHLVRLTSLREQEIRHAVVELPQQRGPKELHVKFCLPAHNTMKVVRVNGRQAQVSGRHNDTVIITTGDQRRFELVGEFV